MLFSAGADLKSRPDRSQPGARWQHNRRARECYHAIRECTKPVIAAINLPDTDKFREAVQTVLKQELQAYLQKMLDRPDRGSKEPSEHAAENSAENLQAVQQANEIIDVALAKKAWTEQDNLKLLRYSFKLTSAQRAQLAQKVYGAINRRELRLTGNVPAL